VVVGVVAILAGVVLAGVLVVQYWWPKPAGENGELTNGALTNGEEATDLDTANWQTYRSEDWGFEVKYPDKYAIISQDSYSIIKPITPQDYLDEPGYYLVLEHRTRRQEQKWADFILEGGVLEDKENEYYIGHESVERTNSSGREVYLFTRALASSAHHYFYMLEQAEDGFPLQGVDCYYWGRFAALGNPYFSDYKKIIETIKFD